MGEQDTKATVRMAEGVKVCIVLTLKPRFTTATVRWHRLTQIPYKKVMIITDPFVVQSGMVMMITSRLDEAKIEFEVFKDVVPDPPIDKVVAGVKAVMDYKPEAIVAVGGGSAIDSAKAIREFASRVGGLDNIALIAVPTTSGTGSEVTSFSVISDPQEREKISTGF